MPAALLRDLVRSTPSGPDATLRVVGAALHELGFTARRTRATPGAALYTRGRATFAFSGHVDVVPDGPGWSRDPHGGETADGRLWGRGTCDMLGSVACFVEAAHRVPDAPCAILLTTDEETGMKAAGHALAEGLLEGLGGIVVGEPTSLAVGVAEKGVLWARVEVAGRTAHGSMPHLGENAIERLARVLPNLTALRAEGEHASLGRGTVSVNRVGGGEAVNQVPAAAWAELDVRYLPGRSEAMVVRDIEDAVAGEAPHATVRVLSHHAPFEIDPGAPLARAALASVRDAGREARAIGLPYGTEASKFAPAGFATVILGPGEAGLAHTDHESILLEDLEAGARAYASLLRRLA